MRCETGGSEEEKRFRYWWFPPDGSGQSGPLATSLSSPARPLPHRPTRLLAVRGLMLRSRHNGLLGVERASLHFSLSPIVRVWPLVCVFFVKNEKKKAFLVLSSLKENWGNALCIRDGRLPLWHFSQFTSTEVQQGETTSSLRSSFTCSCETPEISKTDHTVKTQTACSGRF